VPPRGQETSPPSPGSDALIELIAIELFRGHGIDDIVALARQQFPYLEEGWIRTVVEKASAAWHRRGGKRQDSTEEDEGGPDGNPGGTAVRGDRLERKRQTQGDDEPECDFWFVLGTGSSSQQDDGGQMGVPSGEAVDEVFSTTSGAGPEATSKGGWEPAAGLVKGPRTQVLLREPWQDWSLGWFEGGQNEASKTTVAQAADLWASPNMGGDDTWLERDAAVYGAIMSVTGTASWAMGAREEPDPHGVERNARSGGLQPCARRK
jgi:hypothetical protein